MARQILPVFQTPSTVDALKNRLAAALKGTDQSVQSCSALDDTTRASWGVFYTGAMEYAKSSSSWWDAAAEANQGESLEDELYAWQQKLQKVCTLTVPVFNPQPPAAAGMDAIGTAAKWIGIGVVAIAGAYVVSKAVEFIPKPAPRAAVATERRRRA
jgi:hypothetical protein